VTFADSRFEGDSILPPQAGNADRWALRSSMRIRQCVFQIFVAWLLISCTPTNDKSLSSLIYFEGCTSACWVGIEVGKTNFDQTKKILADRYTIQLTDEILGFILWRTNEADWTNRVDSSHGTVTFSQGVVNSVQFFFENSKFTADDVIKVFGDPTDVMISIDLTKPNHKCAGMQLSYSETGTMIYLDTTQAFKGVEKSQSVTGLWFRSPEDLRDMQLAVQHHGTSAVTNWQGYKDYCEAISQ
jgi:hypothetical protein